MSLKIGILFGGQSHEHPVSLMSVVSILQNLPEEYEPYNVGITLDGKWMHFTGSVEEIENDTWENNPDNEEVLLSTNPEHHGFYNITRSTVDYVDLILPMLHGRGGEDGTVQGLCQLSNVPVVSCDLTSCALAMDKEFTHIIAESYGIPMAKYKVYYNSPDYDLKHMFEECKNEFGLPCYVKPSKEGSSFGAHKINNYSDFAKYIPDAFSYDNKILVEEFIPGTEVGCGVMGNDEVGEVFEIIVETEMYGYEEKYDGYKTSIHVPAVNLTREEMDEVQALSKIIYTALGCNVFARVDFFANDRIVFNEINVIPGFTSHSLFPASFKGVGMTYSEIIDHLIKIALKEV